MSKDILSSLLAQNLLKESDHAKVQWLLKLMQWLQRPRSADEKATKSETVYTVRLKYLLTVLNKNEDWRKNFVLTVTAILVKISSVNQFSRVGFSTQSFVQDFLHRIQDKFLPKNPLSEDLESLIYEIFPVEEESIYIDFIDESVLNELMALFAAEVTLFSKLKDDVLGAAYILSVQILNGVFSIRQEMSYADRDITNFGEYKMQVLLQQALGASEPGLADLSLKSQAVVGLLQKIEKNTEELQNSMPEKGVKIDLVYSFQLQKRKLRRLKLLLNFLTNPEKSAINFRLFISHLILDTYHQKHFSLFLSENLSLLTQRIVKANSHVGEHYVTYTWHEFRKMLNSALGGGALTVLTVYIKFFVTGLGLSGFVKGFVESLNYSASFLTIQISGMTLATKQPSATAPFIAAELQKSTGEARRAIVALLRTQFVAVLGNLLAVFPLAFAISYISFYFEKPIMPVSEAVKVVSSTYITGPTVFFAAFTGVLLFSASIIAGWFENWVIVNHLVVRIQFNESLRRLLGVARTEKLAVFISENSNAIAANIGLGFLLGLTPQFLKFFSLGLDVRHVTLATGSFAAALPSILHVGVDWFDMANALVGILFIGFFNISISFLCAFLLASTSSKIKFSSFVKLLRSGLRQVLFKPWLLIVPEK